MRRSANEETDPLLILIAGNLWYCPRKRDLRQINSTSPVGEEEEVGHKCD